MKIIISERQLRQIIESKEERNLLEVDVEYLLNNTSLVMRTLKKGVDGIVVGGDLYTIDLENDYVNDLLNNLVKVYGSLDIGGRIKPSSFDKLEEVTDNLYMIFNRDIKSLGSLKKVGGSLVLKGCNNLESFGDLEEVGDDLNISMTKLVKFSDEEIREKIKVGGKIKRGLLENNKNQYKLLLENYLEILKNNSLLDSTGIEGRFLNKRQAKELENEIVSNYSDELKFGKEDNDIRRNIFNFDNPLAEKTINGTTLKIVEGLIKDKRKTYLLYTDNQLIGEFYSVKDIKNIVNFLESKLIKNLK